MQNFFSFSMRIIAGFCCLGIVHAGCGNEELFLKNSRNLQGRCEPIRENCIDTYPCGDNQLEHVYLTNGEPCEADGIPGHCDSSSYCIPNCDVQGTIGSACDAACGCAEGSCEGGTCKQPVCDSANCQCSNSSDNGNDCDLEDGKQGICLGMSCVECTDSDKSKCNVGPEPYCHNNTCASCRNQIKDGDETDADCGGSCPKWCNGTVCNQSQKDFCQSGKCIDGVCCNELCDGECESCDLIGSTGTCTPLPLGDSDPTPNSCDSDSNPGTKPGCNDQQQCVAAGGNGELCSTLEDNCLSGACIYAPGGVYKCRKRNGPCKQWNDCASLLCNDGECVPYLLP